MITFTDYPHGEHMRLGLSMPFMLEKRGTVTAVAAELMRRRY